MFRFIVPFALCAAVPALASDQKISEADVPRAAVEAVQSRYAEARQLEWSKEVEEGETRYEVRLDNGQEVTLTKDGRVVNEETRIEYAQVPEPVRKGFTASKYGKWKVTKAERVLEGGRTSYEVYATRGKATVEALFSEQGKLVKEEKGRAK